MAKRHHYVDFLTLPKLWDLVPVLPEELLSLVEPGSGSVQRLTEQIESLPQLWINPGERQATIEPQTTAPVSRGTSPNPDQLLLVEDYRHQGQLLGHGLSYWVFDPQSASWALIRRYNLTGPDDKFTSLTDPLPPNSWAPVLAQLGSDLSDAPIPEPDLELAAITGIEFREAD